MEKKKFISVMFKCCNVYNRIYINKEGTAYTGCCPKCLKRVNVKVGPGGVDCRFFEAK